MSKLNFDNTRQPKILNLLLQSETAITASYIANYLSVSTRLVRYEIKALKQKCMHLGCEIQAKPREGYRLIGNRDQLMAVIKQTMGELLPFANTGTKDKFVREQLILRHLISRNTIVSVNEIMTTFSISRQTLFQDINRANETIEPYNLEMKYIPYQGIHLYGTETRKRMLLARETAFFKIDQLLPHIRRQLPHISFSIDALLPIVTQDFGVSVSQVELFNLYVHIMVQAFRIFNHNGVDASDVQITDYLHSKYTYIAQSFIQNHFPSITYSEAELDYLISLIHASGIGSDTMLETAATLLESIESDTGITFPDTMRTQLGKFLVPMIIKAKNHFSSTPIRVREIKRLKPLSIELAYRISEHVNAIMGISIFYNDICALAFIVDQNLVLDSSNVVIVSLSIGELLSQGILIKLEQRYPQFCFKYMELYETRPEDLENCAFIISDTTFNHQKKFIPIDIILSEQSIRRIDTFIQSRNLIRYQTLLDDAKVLNYETVDDVLDYIASQYDTSKHYLKKRDATLTYEVNKSCAVVCLFGKSVTQLYRLQKPILWKNEAIDYLCVYASINNHQANYHDVLNFIEIFSNLEREN